MDLETFKKLLAIVAPYIRKQDTNMRQAIPVEDKLATTLRFLASGDSFQSLSVLFRIAPNTISKFVPTVCSGIFKALKSTHLKVPSTQQEWIDIAAQFDDMWNFPNCIGAVDGKHVYMSAPAHSGSTFFNYKGSHSIVLMAIADANYRILYADVGCNGRISDGGVFGKCSFQHALESNTLNLPTARPLPGRDLNVPFLLVADDAFRMQNHLLKPFPGKNLSADQRIFNYRLSRARRIIENTFGIMTNRFRVLSHKTSLNAEKTTFVALACCALHNFLLKNKASYVSPNLVDRYDVDGTLIPGAWRNELLPNNNGIEESPTSYISNETKAYREEYAKYFMSTVGEVHWQYKHIT